MAMKPSLTKHLFATTLFSCLMVSQAALAQGPGFAPGPAGWDYYSIQNILIGATIPLQASANYGQGVTVATIDTGVTSSWVGFGGLNVSSYQCLNGRCSTAAGDSDNNGHGTFVASEIIGGVQFSNGNGMLGVSPFSNLVSVKVLDAQGSGSSGDVNKGIRYAVDHGAKVINLSLGPSGSAAQQAAFFNSISDGVNFAASRNAVIVFAGGNDAALFAGGASIGSATPNWANPNYFSNQALKHLLFVGATDSNMALTSYSNKPGQAGFYSTTGKFTSFQSLWLMADGGGVANGQCVDCIVGAPNVTTANYLALDAGTSMATPQVAGAAALLAARWPVLLTQQTLTAVLEASATDLGAKGVDAVYGNGFLNLTKAFQPIGTLTVNTKNGSSVSVTQGGSSIVSGGALGSMSKLGSVLTNYTAFDSFQRDFVMNLSGLISAKSTSSAAAQTVSAPKTTGATTHFADGSSLAFGNSVTDNPVIDHPSSKANDGWFMAFTDSSGTTMAAGSGFPASASFAGALWGGDSAAAEALTSLGASNALLNLAEGGTFVAFGSNLGGGTRMAFSWSETGADATPGMDITQADASSFGAGISTQLGEDWKGGVTFGLLDEKNGLLGTTYVAGPLSLGENNRSMSMGLTSTYALGDDTDLVVDAAIVRASGAALTGGIISDVSTLYARTMGAALVERNAVKKGDHLSLSMRAPLRVMSGSASVAMTSVDGDGVASTTTQRFGLTPSGNEMDFSVGYVQPVNDRLSWNMTMDARRDAGNVRGAHDEDVLIGAKLSF